MQSSVTKRGLFRFGIFQIDLAAGELRKAGVKQKLAGQPFQVLQVLLEHPGEVVTREQLQKRLWPDKTVVDYDLALKKAINRIREILGDSADSPRYIETVPRRGYRFIAPVERVEESTDQKSLSDETAASNLPLPQTAGTIADRRTRRVVTITIALALGAVSIFWFGERHASPVPMERKLTANAEEAPILNAGISPDGKYLAFTDTTGLYVKQVETGELHRITLPQGLQMLPDSWFPDDTDFIVTAFEHSTNRVSLWRVSVFGDTPWKIIDDAFGAAVSPDGQRIAFLRGGPDYDRLGREVWVMQANGEDASRISELPDAKSSDWGKYLTSATWSPTGEQVAYIRIDPGPQKRSIAIFTQPVGPGPARMLVSNVEPAICWTSAGTIVYAQREASSQAEPALWALQLDSHNGEAIANPRRISASGEFLKISATSDGRRLMLFRGGSGAQIFLSEWLQARPGWSPLQRLSFHQPASRPWAWTQDSNSVIFTSNRPGRSELFKQNIAEPTPQLLASSSAEIKVARLMPDGNSALFSEAFQDSSGKVTLFRLPLSGGLPVPLVSGFGINNFQCARLPSHLCVFDEGRNNATVLVAYDSVTGAQHELSKLTDDPYGVDWNLSPDGSRIAMVLGERVRFLSVDSGSFYDVAVHGWMGLHGVDWSPDSQTVFLAASAPGLPGALLQMDLHGNAHELISTLGNAPIWWGIPSPNGKYQAVLLAVGENNVWMLENF